MVKTDPISPDLAALIARLTAVRAVVTTAITALEAQRADRDSDIALALLRCVADPLFDEIEKLESLIPRTPAEQEGGAA